MKLFSKTKLAIILTIAIFSFRVITGCSKNADTGDISQEQQSVNEVLRQSSLSSVGTSYLLLSSKERQILWEEKLNIILKNDQTLLSADQTKIINEIKTMLITFGIAKLRANQAIGNNFLEKNLAYYKQHFTSKQLYFLIQHPYYSSTFSIFKLINDDGIGYEGDGVPNCACLYDLGCETTKVCDARVKCTKVEKCGLFGTSNCEGLCR